VSAIAERVRDVRPDGELRGLRGGPIGRAGVARVIVSRASGKEDENDT
jgi:hypothetical protein